MQRPSTPRVPLVVLTSFMLLGLAGSPEVGAQTTVEWFGGNGTYPTSDRWTDVVTGLELTPPSYPNNVDPLVTEDHWHVIIPSTVGGQCSFPGDVTIDSLLFQDGHLRSAIGGPADLTIVDSFSWTGGTHSGSGSTICLGQLEIVGPVCIANGRMLVNSDVGSATGVLELDSGGPGGGISIVNSGGAELTLQGPGEWLGVNNPFPTLTNTGTLRKTGVDEFHFQVLLAGTGPVLVEEGTLRLHREAALENPFTVEAGAVLEFDGVGANDYFLNAGGISGAGKVLAAGPGVHVGASWNVGTTEITTGELEFLTAGITETALVDGGDVTGTLIVTDALGWTNGFLGPGLVVLGDGSASVITPMSSGTRLKGTLQVGDASGDLTTVTVVGGGQLYGDNGSEIVNLAYAVFELAEGDLSVSTGHTSDFHNEGTFLKTGNAQSILAFQFENTGLVRIQEGTLRCTGSYTQLDGTTELAGGVWDAPLNSFFDIDGGQVTGSGLITNSLDLEGTLSPEGAGAAGLIEIGRDLLMGPGGRLQLELAGVGVANHDRVEVNEELTLDGFLGVSLLSGYVPDPAEFFEVATSSTLSGAFLNVSPGNDVLTQDGLGVFTVHYGPGSPFDEDHVVLTNYRPVGCTAPGRIFWTSLDGTLHRRSLDGSVLSGPTLVTLGEFRGLDLDVGNDHFYLTSPPNVMSYSGVDFAAPDYGLDFFVPSPPRPEDLSVYRDQALSTGYVFWTEAVNGEIRRMDLDGSNITTIVSGLGTPTGIEANPYVTQVFWVDRGARKIQRSDANGASIIDIFTMADGLGEPCDLALELGTSQVYFSEIVAGVAQIRAVGILSGLVTDVVVSDLGTVTGVDDSFAIDIDQVNGHIYWVDRAGGKIERAALDGTDRVTVFDGLFEPYRIALDVPRRDCNGNGVPDNCDIVAGTSRDLNQDGIPDECRVRAPSVAPIPSGRVVR